MKLTTIREFRTNLAAVTANNEPVLVTKNGKPAGVFIPWNEDADLPLDIKKEAFKDVGSQLAGAMAKVDEKELLDDFKVHRKHHRS